MENLIVLKNFAYNVTCMEDKTDDDFWYKCGKMVTAIRDYKEEEKKKPKKYAA